LRAGDPKNVPRHWLHQTAGRSALEEIQAPVPRPAADQILIHVACSSLNPLEYKLAELNFFGRKPPVILGFDLSGIVVAKGDEVRDFAVGDEVTAMADSNGDGGWAAGGQGGYALAREFLAVKKPRSVSSATRQRDRFASSPLSWGCIATSIPATPSTFPAERVGWGTLPSRWAPARSARPA
jgi:hypothetical protein